MIVLEEIWKLGTVPKDETLALITWPQTILRIPFASATKHRQETEDRTSVLCDEVWEREKEILGKYFETNHAQPCNATMLHHLLSSLKE